MRKIYVTLIMISLSLGVFAQKFTNTFEESIDPAFINEGQFFAGQHGSNLIIVSQGHDEFENVEYTFNDGVSATPLSLKLEDTIYVRAKATFDGDIEPILVFDLIDENGVGADQYDPSEIMTLTRNYQIFKFSVSDWLRVGFGAGDPNAGVTVDSTKITSLTMGPNPGFFSFPPTNGNGETINNAFEGTIYIDYVHIGTSNTASEGPFINSVVGFTESFDTDVSSNIVFSSDALTPAITNTESLGISTAGHDEWDYVQYAIPNNVIDMTQDSLLEFTASATKDATYTGEIGIMVVAVDEAGLRLNYPGSLISLTETSKTVQIKFDEFVSGTENNGPFNAERVAYFDILINPGFASSPSNNDLGNTVNTAFEGVVFIDEVKLGSDVVIGVFSSNTKSQSFSIYPNPASDNLNLRNDALRGGNYTISDVNGVTKQSGVIDNNTLSVSNLESGFYTMSIIKENTVYTTTMIIQ